MKIRHYLVALGALMLAGCSQPTANAESRGGGGTIVAINHTKWAINHFSVDGQSGIDIIRAAAAAAAMACRRSGGRV
jgi:hypothetical protein